MGGGLVPRVVFNREEQPGRSQSLACVVAPLPSSSQTIAESSASLPPLSIFDAPPVNDGTVDKGIVDDSVDVDGAVSVDTDEGPKERPSSSGPRGASVPTATFGGFPRISQSARVGGVVGSK